MSKPIRMPQADEQIVLEELQVELVHPVGSAAFSVVAPAAYHYLGGTKPVGERLYYVWQPGAGSGSPCWSFARGRQTFASSGRSGLAGREAQRAASVWGLVTNNARFLILPHGHYPNLATRVMGSLCLKLAAAGLAQARYAHPVWLAESFVDTQLFRGTAYKASGLDRNWGRRKEAMAAAAAGLLCET